MRAAAVSRSASLRFSLALAVAPALVSASCQRSGDSRPPDQAAATATTPTGATGYCRRSGATTPVGGPSATGPSASEPSASEPSATGPIDGDPLRPAHTFSIVARDPATGDLGVAVQSHWFAVGSTVTWAEPGVGAVATQSFVDPAYGPRGLALMRGGSPPADALAKLLAADAAREVRQVAFVDASGRAAAHTGGKCIEHAGHHVGAGYSVQANMMGTDRVVPAMSRAYEGARGDLAERLMSALEAAQAAGGDIRGCQSAALLVVSGTRSEKPWADTRFDLRVDDSPDPIGELRRLLRLARAYDHMNRGDAAVEKGDMNGALDHYGAAARMSGGDSEMLYWQAVALAAHGDIDHALPLFRRVFADDPRWIELTRRLTRPGILPDTPEGRAMVERITREAAPR
ncbi:MAG TPA: DUF1028 domain-containing protein [Kofleriaceae bacterium]|nr:DUF1028 domain-containing protein [Kofleriaceae bacterium]